MAPTLTLITAPTPELTSSAEFADAMSALASGVVLVTCWVGDRPWGMTVTAFASASANPPTVLVALSSEAASTTAITATQRFGVSVLAEEQVVVAHHGSAPGASKFIDAFVESDDGRSATPVVAGALAHLDCRVADSTQVADHTVFFGHVRAVRASNEGAPLLYHRRKYRMLTDPVSTRQHAERSAR
jgi:flavin reductase (DIM6/NTAB) family NADH-FMN oxidoreductase RutF